MPKSKPKAKKKQSKLKNFSSPVRISPLVLIAFAALAVIVGSIAVADSNAGKTKKVNFEFTVCDGNGTCINHMRAKVWAHYKQRIWHHTEKKTADRTGSVYVPANAKYVTINSEQMKCFRHNPYYYDQHTNVWRANYFPVSCHG